MANNFITGKEAAKRIAAIMNKYADEYQKASKCSDDKKNLFLNSFAMSLSGGLFNGPNPEPPNTEGD